MSKFKAGDKVVWMGRTRETFDEDLTVGEVYIVLGYHRGYPDSIEIEDSDGKEIVFMLESNFDLYVEQPAVIDDGLRYFKYLGEQPTPPGKEKHIPLPDDGLTVGKVYTTDRYDDASVERFIPDMLITLDNAKIYWVEVHHFLEVNKPATQAVKDENDSHVGTGKLKVTMAQFTDRNGDTITIKRSACRHYYMKKPGQPQQRIHKKQLSGILSGLAAAL